MPELPEVETVRRGLRKQILGARIRDIELDDCRIFQCPPAVLLERLPGQQLLEIRRRGKFLIFQLSRDQLIIHLGMTGQLTVRYQELPDSPGFFRHPLTGLERVRQHAPDRHTHLQVHFEDDRSLLFRDVRKFGKCHLITEPDQLEAVLGHLGTEPLSEAYSLESFLNGMKGRRMPVKALLLDQRFVAGVGNIYADEALFEARIHPQRRVASLRRYEKERLFSAVREVLKKGVVFGGTSLRDYIDSDGREGTHQDELLAYGRTNEPCPRCGTAIQKIVVAQRGTHFCPSCQLRSKPIRTLTKKR